MVTFFALWQLSVPLIGLSDYFYPSPRRVAVLALIGVLAAVTVSLATPLGGAIWSYILSFRNSAIDHASQRFSHQHADWDDDCRRGQTLAVVAGQIS